MTITNVRYHLTTELGSPALFVAIDTDAGITGYGEAIGLMFQAVDDVLDVTQTTSHLGKNAHKDADQGKLTYPGLLGLEASRREIQKLRAAACSALEPLGPEAEPLLQLCQYMAARTR